MKKHRRIAQRQQQFLEYLAQTGNVSRWNCRNPSRFVEGASADELAEVYYKWREWARPSQLPPSGDWRVWLSLAGRGFGKTRAGAEYVRSRVNAGARRIALVGPIAEDTRYIMVEGDSGILAISPPDEMPRDVPSKRRRKRAPAPDGFGRPSVARRRVGLRSGDRVLGEDLRYPL